MKPGEIHPAPDRQEGRQIVPRIDVHQFVYTVARVALEFRAGIAVELHGLEKSAARLDHVGDVLAEDNARRPPVRGRIPDMLCRKLRRGSSAVKIGVVIHDLAVVSGYDLLEHDIEAGVPSFSISGQHFRDAADRQHLAPEPFVKKMTLAGLDQTGKLRPASIALDILN
jgi:hypothetical protein